MTRADSKQHPLLYCRLFMNNKTETIGTIDPIQAQVALRSRLDQPRVTKVKYGQEIIELDLREKILQLGLDLHYRQGTVVMQEEVRLVVCAGDRGAGLVVARTGLGASEARSFTQRMDERTTGGLAGQSIEPRPRAESIAQTDRSAGAQLLTKRSGPLQLGGAGVRDEGVGSLR